MDSQIFKGSQGPAALAVKVNATIWCHLVPGINPAWWRWTTKYMTASSSAGHENYHPCSCQNAKNCWAALLSATLVEEAKDSCTACSSLCRQVPTGPLVGMLLPEPELETRGTENAKGHQRHYWTNPEFT